MVCLGGSSEMGWPSCGQMICDGLSDIAGSWLDVIWGNKMIWPHVASYSILAEAHSYGGG